MLLHASVAEMKMFDRVDYTLVRTSTSKNTILLKLACSD